MTTSYINGISRGGVSGTFTYSVASGSGNKPITFVSWFDAARFTNWMHNGQTTGAQTFKMWRRFSTAMPNTFSHGDGR